MQGVTTFTDADTVVPSWSQDGQWIYFPSDHDSNVRHIWKVAVNGGLPVMVTRHRGFAAFESGHNVFYTRLSEPGIGRIPRDGGPERLFGPGRDQTTGHWAEMKFISSRQLLSENQRLRVWIFKPNALPA